MKLLLNLVRMEFKKNRVITTALAVFLILSGLFHGRRLKGGRYNDIFIEWFKVNLRFETASF